MANTSSTSYGTVASAGAPPTGGSEGSPADDAVAKATARAAADAEYAAGGGVLRTKRPPGMVKRSVAIHLAYVGTAFKGLQVNRDGAPDSTVEAVLERAVYDAGLIAESNFGDLFKVKWTRNSRTDKGVHSLATVVGLRVLLPGDDRWDTDPEGLELVEAINARLPPQVRVLSVQRVNKKFHARRFCFDRTYEYQLPAYLLVPQSHGPAEAAAMSAALARLREALSCYVGTHPFQNYTAKRKSYTQTGKDIEAKKAARQAAAAAAAAEAIAQGEAVATGPSGAVGAPDGGLELDLDLEERAAAAAAAAAGPAAAAEGSSEEGEEDARARGGRGLARAAKKKGRKAEEEDGPMEEDDEGLTDDGTDYGSEAGGAAGEEGGEVGAPRRWVQSCRWLYDKSDDPRDRITIRHFRTITSFTADDPAPLVPGGVPCVRLRVTGMSFMLHQIRHMIGGALAVARGSLPLPLLRASLAAHARVNVPRAPPHTLVLSDCSFPPFRKAGGDEARVARWSGERLQLRAGGQANLARFREQELDPALNALLAHPDWERFEAVQGRFYWDPQAQEEVMAAHAKWEASREERARQRLEEKKLAAAAAVAAAEAAAEETAVAATPGQAADGAVEGVPTAAAEAVQT